MILKELFVQSQETPMGNETNKAATLPQRRRSNPPGDGAAFR
ncbi:hypothetical protein SAMN05421809_3589 [Natronorubrum daqingense]|uniref:Uncharacterized protein n=1 Tax=Natronorubrum daqingense TaxID=588898 RepID=A0A1N7FYY6_9EURY|nr:hypothetical protein SAMN05421809_3589 [Natronorubrum daqingense]